MTVMTSSALPLKQLGRGKVRDIYEVDSERLLLVATDRWLSWRERRRKR